jgi:hypothetical protein
MIRKLEQRHQKAKGKHDAAHLGDLVQLGFNEQIDEQPDDAHDERKPENNHGEPPKQGNQPARLAVWLK